MSDVQVPTIEQLVELLRSLPANSATDKTVNAAIKELTAEHAGAAKRLSEQRKVIGRLQKGLTDVGEPQREALAALLPALNDELAKQISRLQRRFARELAEQLAARQLALQGQLPNLDCSLLRISIAELSTEAVILYGKDYAKLESHPLDAEAVANAVVARLNGGLGSGGSTEELFTRLQLAYRDVRARLGNTDEPLPIRRLLPYIALECQDETFRKTPDRKHWRSYLAHDFSYDLRRLLSEPAYQPRITLTVATRQFTRDEHQVLWIPLGADGNGKVYSHLQINEA